MEKFRERMRIAMSELEVTPTALAKKTGISRKTIYLAMNGICALRLQTMRMIAGELAKEAVSQKCEAVRRMAMLDDIIGELRTYFDDNHGGDE